MPLFPVKGKTQVCGVWKTGPMVSNSQAKKGKVHTFTQTVVTFNWIVLSSPLSR